MKIDFKKSYKELTGKEKGYFDRNYSTKEQKKKKIILLIVAALIIPVGSYLSFSNIIRDPDFINILSLIVLVLFYVSVMLLFSTMLRNNYETSEMYLKEHKKDNDIEAKKKKERIFLVISISLVFVYSLLLIISAINASEDADYEARKRCWDKGMDYNEETGRCLTANEWRNK